MKAPYYPEIIWRLGIFLDVYHAFGCWVRFLTSTTSGNLPLAVVLDAVHMYKLDWFDGKGFLAMHLFEHGVILVGQYHLESIADNSLSYLGAREERMRNDEEGK